MINEASKLRMATDIIESKIAQKSIEIRQCNDEQKSKVLTKQFEDLIRIQDMVQLGNDKFVDEVIKRNGGRKND